MAAEKNASSMGSVWVLRNAEDTPAAVAPSRRLSMASIKTQQLGASSKFHENVIPKNETVNTPPRRSTRSINVSSQSTDYDSRPFGEGVVVTGSEGTGMKIKLKDTGKRQIEEVVPELTSRKRKSIPSLHKPQPRLRRIRPKVC